MNTDMYFPIFEAAAGNFIEVIPTAPSCILTCNAKCNKHGRPLNESAVSVKHYFAHFSQISYLQFKLRWASSICIADLVMQLNFFRVFTIIITVYKESLSNAVLSE